MPFRRVPEPMKTNATSLRQSLLLGALGASGGAAGAALALASGAGTAGALVSGLAPPAVALVAVLLLLRHDRALVRSRAALALIELVEDTRDSALVVEDGDGRMIYANAACTRMFEDMQTGGMALAIDRHLRRPGPDLSAEIALLQGQARGGRGGRREVVSNQPRHEAHWLEVAVDPLPGGLLAWRVRDVTARRRQLDRSGDRLALLSRALDKAPFGIVLTDGDLVVREANSAFRAMVDNVNVAGRSVLDLVLAEERPAFERMLRRATDGPTAPVESLDVQLAQPEDKVVTIFASQAVVHRGNQGGGLLLHVADSTERKRLELQFAQSQKMQAVGQLAGGIAHDFNNMLTAIIGFCDLMLQRFHTGDQTFADTMQIKQNANRAAGLVRQLLAFSRQQTVRPRVIDLTDVIADLANLLRRLISERIELKIRHQRDLWKVKLDQGQFEQVIINLAVNARDAMPGGGVLSIDTANVHLQAPQRRRDSVLAPGDYVRIAISDSGIGIPKANIDKIFDPFFTTKEVGSGTGLGLSMVYGAITQAGGQVTVDSEGDGKGAVFSLYIPRHEPAEGDAEPAPHVEEERDTGRDTTGGGTVLLVEDEDAVRLFAARALRSKGYTVMEARTGEAALAILNAGEERFDLLVTDMMMPELDGASLIREARRKAPDLPVICISGYTQDAMAQEVFDLPRVSFLPKPFSLKQLAGRVKDAIESPDDLKG